MNTLILAAGFGTRLLEYGETTPKGLIPTANGTLMDHLVSECSSLQAPIALVTNDRFYSKYTKWFSQEYPLTPITILNDGATNPESRLGAIGDILHVIEKLSWGKDDLLVVPSDTFFEFSLVQFVSFSTEKGSFTTVVRDMKEKNGIANRLGCPTVIDDQIVAFIEKPATPPTTLAAIPFYYYPQSVLELLSEYKFSGGNLDAPGSIIPWLLSKRQYVAAFMIDSSTLDVGTLADVQSVNSL